jgi:hypothetical protein
MKEDAGVSRTEGSQDRVLDGRFHAASAAIGCSFTGLPLKRRELAHADK